MKKLDIEKFWLEVSKQAKKHPKFVRYIKYNIFGFSVYIVSTFFYLIIGVTVFSYMGYSLFTGWIVLTLTGFFGGFYEFFIQDKFVYGKTRLFQRIHRSLKRLDEILLLDGEEKP